MNEKIRKEIEGKFICEKCDCREIEEVNLDETTVQVVCKNCRKILGFGKKIKLDKNQNPKDLAENIIQKMREKFGKDNVSGLEELEEPEELKIEGCGYKDDCLREECFREKMPKELRKLMDEVEGSFERQGFKLTNCCKCIYCGKYFKEIKDVKKHIKLEHNQNGR